MIKPFAEYKNLIWAKVNEQFKRLENMYDAYDYTKDDMFQDLGMIYQKCVDKFDEKKHNKFVTYFSTALDRRVKDINSKIWGKLNKTNGTVLPATDEMLNHFEGNEDPERRLLEGKVLEYVKTSENKELLELYIQGYNQNQIAAKLGMDQSNVSRILQNEINLMKEVL